MKITNHERSCVIYCEHPRQSLATQLLKTKTQLKTWLTFQSTNYLFDTYSRLVARYLNSLSDPITLYWGWGYRPSIPEMLQYERVDISSIHVWLVPIWVTWTKSMNHCLYNRSLYVGFVVFHCFDEFNKCLWSATVENVATGLEESLVRSALNPGYFQEQTIFSQAKC